MTELSLIAKNGHEGLYLLSQPVNRHGLTSAAAGTLKIVPPHPADALLSPVKQPDSHISHTLGALTSRDQKAAKSAAVAMRDYLKPNGSSNIIELRVGEEQIGPITKGDGKLTFQNLLPAGHYRRASYEIPRGASQRSKPK